MEASDSEERPPAPTPTARVGRYRILGELARGGMGIVYRAHDDRLGREVALKSPLPEQATDDDRRRFLREARAASRVSHPHIVPIYEVFEEAGRPWLAMELVDGRTLRSALRTNGALPLEDVLRIGEELADALDAAHDGGVLHRDLNPSNIMLTPRGGARLMDFGLARVAEPDPSQASTAAATSRGHLAGTLGYMSPEQILARQVGPPSDLFALGTVLYEMLTGRQAFAAASTGEVFDLTLHNDPPPLSQFVRDAPAEIQRIVTKALAKRPDERYQSARDISADLRALRRRLESRDHEREASAVRPRRTEVLVAGLILAGVVVAAVAWYRSRAEPVLVLGTPRQLTALPGWEAEAAVAPEGSFVAYASDQSGNPDIWLLDVIGGETLRLTTDPAIDRDPTWFPDGSAIAFVSDRGGPPGIWRTPRLGGAATLVLANAEDPAISPDGSQIAFSRREASGFYRVGVTALSAPDKVRILTGSEHGLWDHRQPAWSPDGRTIVYAASRNLWTVPSTGGGATSLTDADAADSDPAWSRDGRIVYFSSNREGTRALWRVRAAGGPAERMTGGHGPERHPSVSADGTRLVFSTFVDNADLVLREIASGQEHRTGSERVERSPVFSPDGRALAFVSDRWGGRYDIWLQPLEAGRSAGEPRRLTDHTGSVAQPAFSPDGRWIAYHRVLEGQRDIWIVSTSGGASIQFTADAAQDIHPDWSPDGRQIVFVSGRSGADQIWVAPVAAGQPRGTARPVTTGNLQPDAPTWSPDGSTIAFLGQGDDDREVYVIAPDGLTPARKLTSGAGAWRVCWDRASGDLWASGFWGSSTLSLRIVDLHTGETRPPSMPVSMGSSFDSSDFDISWDGRRLAFAREELRGDLWVYEGGSKIF
jgi:Tol biopolymer transport system component/predicted Ser/Thr protein kinase